LIYGELLKEKMQKYKKILLTGASGQLGTAILNIEDRVRFLTPAMDILDITKTSSIERYFKKHNFDAVIHCAALARMTECEKDPITTIETNIKGTANLVAAVISKEGKLERPIRFMHISTDGVYPGTKGNYSEKDETIPCNIYGWTKLGAECAVHLLKNFCIIRTSFFNPDKIRFNNSATDLYSSKVTIDYLAEAVIRLLESEFVGTINIGGKRQSDYERYKKFKPSLRPCKGIDISKGIGLKLAKDASLNYRQWKKIERGLLKTTNG